MFNIPLKNDPPKAFCEPSRKPVLANVCNELSFFHSKQLTSLLTSLLVADYGDYIPAVRSLLPFIGQCIPLLFHCIPRTQTANSTNPLSTRDARKPPRLSYLPKLVFYGIAILVLKLQLMDFYNRTPTIMTAIRQSESDYQIQTMKVTGLKPVASSGSIRCQLSGKFMAKQRLGHKDFVTKSSAKIRSVITDDATKQREVNLKLQLVGSASIFRKKRTHEILVVSVDRTA